MNTPDSSLPPLVDGPKRTMLVEIEVSTEFEKRLDNQWEVEREIHADRWKWQWKSAPSTPSPGALPTTQAVEVPNWMKRAAEEYHSTGRIWAGENAHEKAVSELANVFAHHAPQSLPSGSQHEVGALREALAERDALKQENGKLLAWTTAIRDGLRGINTEQAQSLARQLTEYLDSTPTAKETKLT